MSLAITPVSFPQLVQAPSIQPSASGSGEFKNILSSAIQHVESSQANANSAVQNFVSGQDQELHSTILATQNAELQFEMFMQVRNKVVCAYEEIMKMQL